MLISQNRKPWCILSCIAALTSQACASTQLVLDNSLQTTALAELQMANTSANRTVHYDRSKLIAADFASTLRHASVFDSPKIKFNNAKPETEFGKIFIRALNAAGYALQWNDIQSTTKLSLLIESAELGKQRYAFVIKVGELEMKREYEVLAEGVKPSGSMFVREVLLDDAYLN